MNSSDYKQFPETPGVYLMKDAEGRILYVGKAGNLRRRVSSYFERPHDVRIQTLVARIATIDHRDTDTAIEALILEAELIRKFSPPFNVKEKDDKSFLYIEITKEKFPRVLLVRGRDVAGEGKRFGPFTSASSVREALKILRKIFPWSTHEKVCNPNQRIHPNATNKKNIRSIRINSDSSDWACRKRPCFDYEIGLCPGPALARSRARII